jgi:hypothetical protein
MWGLPEDAKGQDLVTLIRDVYHDENDAIRGHARPILRKILIPNEGRIECLRFLDRMNINRMSLFPDMDGAAAYINGLWPLEFLTPLGWMPELPGKRPLWDDPSRLE